MKQRNRYFGALRGIAILMVVAIHTYKPDMSNWAGLVNMGIRQILNCAVPLFFALSGFFLYPKVLQTKTEAIQFWQRQVPKVYIPTLLWSLPLLGLALMHGESLVWSIVKLLVCGYGIYYFIAVIVQLYLLLPLLQRCKVHKLGGVFLLL